MSSSLALIFLRDSFCLSAYSLLRQRHDILDFSCCPLSCVFQVTLANLQKFGFQFHLKSSPSAFSGYGWSVDQLITSLLATPCWRDLTRSKQLFTGCNSWLSCRGFLRINQLCIIVTFRNSIILRMQRSAVFPHFRLHNASNYGCNRHQYPGLRN